MKKYIILFTVSIFLSSCVNEDINTDPNSAYTTVPETLVSYAQKELSDYVNTPNVNENNFRLTMQYWQEVTYTNESTYDFANRNVADNVWIDNYVNVLNNLNQARKLISIYVPTPAQTATWPVKKQNELAIIDMLMIYTYQNMVDTFGNVPFKQAISLNLYSLPVYDDASKIYEELIIKLNQDLSNLVAGASFGATEYYYQGNIPKWKKFGNSLLLKLGIALCDVNPTLAQSTISTAITGGVITSSADKCGFNYLATSPNYSPLYENLSASGRDDYYACKTIVDFMNTTSDSRISKYFDFKPLTTIYVGQDVGQAAPFSDFSPVANFAYTATTPGIILNDTEVAFYLAEAAARYGTVASASTAYNTAVTASFLQWGLTIAAANTYLLTKPYDPINWKKSIGEQAWVAMYNQPNTAWNFYRRLDFPVLLAPSNAIANAGGKVPVRLTYPPKESATNPSNLSAASSAIGGDKLTTKIFWDKF